MLDHITLTVPDIVRSRAFYEKSLAPLGYHVLMEFQEYLGFGDRKPYFWLKRGDAPQAPMHIAFVAGSRGAVEAFHKAAIEAGGRDNGAPGIRADYHKNYYGAFVLDLDGHPIEAVCHAPVAAAKKAAANTGKSKKKAGAKKGKRR